VQREQVVIHRLDDARQRGVRLGQLGAHAPALGHVGDDAADLDGAVGQPPGRGPIVHPARDAVGSAQAVLDVGVAAGGQRAVERVIGRAVVRMQGRLPVLHLGVGHRAAEQPVGPGPLEQLLDAAVGEREREIHVLPDDVQQAAEAVAGLGQPGVGVDAPGHALRESDAGRDGVAQAPEACDGAACGSH
jgi:hypothetical protein